MPIVTCPNCKNRMLKPSPTCPNCGYALAASLFSAPTTTTTFASPPTSTTSPSPAFFPSPFTSAAKSSKLPAPSTSTTPTAPTHSSSPTTTGTIPFSTSDLDGIVIDPPTTFEIPFVIHWSYIVLGLIFIPFSLIFLLEVMVKFNNPGFRTNVTRVRVQRSSGSMRDARIEGDLMGAALSQGDLLSLHGYDRGGALIVTHGYNHSSGGQIIIDRRNSPIGPRILACILVTCWILYLTNTALIPFIYSHVH